MCSRRLRNRLANQAMDQTPHRAARASLAALVIAERWADFGKIPCMQWL